MAITIRPASEIPPPPKGFTRGLSANAKALQPGEAIRVDLDDATLESLPLMQKVQAGTLTNAKQARRIAGLPGRLRSRIDRPGKALWLWLDEDPA